MGGSPASRCLQLGHAFAPVLDGGVSASIHGWLTYHDAGFKRVPGERDIHDNRLAVELVRQTERRYGTDGCRTDTANYWGSVIERALRWRR